MGVREWKIRGIRRIDKAVFGFTTRLFVTCPLNSECFDIVVMGNVGGRYIRSLGWLKRDKIIHEMRLKLELAFDFFFFLLSEESDHLHLSHWQLAPHPHCPPSPASSSVKNIKIKMSSS